MMDGTLKRRNWRWKIRNNRRKRVTMRGGRHCRRKKRKVTSNDFKIPFN